MHGLFIGGTCLGLKRVPKTNPTNNQKFEEVYLGLSIPAVGGYAGDHETVDVRISRNQLDARLDEYYQGMKDAHIVVPVFVKVWVSRSGNAGKDFYLSGDGKPLVD